MTAILYTRVSSKKQADSGLGKEAQESTCRAFAAKVGLEVSAVFSDDGVSGSAPIEERPKLMEALASLKRGDTLLVAKRDRIARDLMVTIMVERDVAQHGAYLVSASGEGSGDNSPTGILMRRVLDAFAEFERGVGLARTRAALAAKKARGERMGGHLRYGYMTEGDKLVEDRTEQEVIRRVHTMRGQKASLATIADTLNNEGVKPRMGGRWHPTTVARLAKEKIK